MKKLAFLTLLSTPTMAHIAVPETEFFREQMAIDPNTQNILSYCGLIGIHSEEACRAEFYKNDFVNERELEAAGKCVEASGLKYRMAYDKYFKVDQKAQSWVSNQDPKTGYYHIEYLLDKEQDGENGKRHRHIWNEIEKKMAGEEIGTAKVKEFKERFAKETVTGETTASASVSVLSKIEGIFKSLGFESGGELGIEKSKSIAKEGPTQQQLDVVYNNGYSIGYTYPQYSTVRPSEYCYEKSDCHSALSKDPLPNPDGDVRPISIVKPPEKPAETPKTETPKTPTDDFLEPIKNKDSTGGIGPKTDAKTSKEEIKGVSTPVTNQVFIRDMDDCVNRVIEEYYKVEGVTELDPDKESKDDEKARMEKELADGFCDSKYWTPEFCFLWQADLDSTKAEFALEKQSKYDQAMFEFQTTGYCDSDILTKQFCDAAAYKLEVTPVHNDEPEFIDPWNPPTNNPPTTIPEGTGGVDCINNDCLSEIPSDFVGRSAFPH
ncbi:MAG: hypothetical protein EOP04_06845 [Proteobacteria bacterium]|nr:MAG: hypothetical protein EOP04_06845 [Pseudomonadota bacterium]